MKQKKIVKIITFSDEQRKREKEMREQKLLEEKLEKQREKEREKELKEQQRKIEREEKGECHETSCFFLLLIKLK